MSLSTEASPPEGRASTTPSLRPGRLLRNFGSLSAGKLLGDVCTFVLFVVLSRTFGEEGLGQYSFAIAFTGFFAVFADYGLYYLGLKEMSRSDVVVNAVYPNLLLLRLLLSGVVFFVLLVFVALMPLSPEMKAIVIVIGLFQIVFTVLDGFATIFLARGMTLWAALLELSLRAAVAVLASAAALAGFSLVVTVATMPLVCLVQTVLAYALVRRRFGHMRPRASWRRLVRILREATPYAGTIFLYQLSTRTDVVMLGLLAGAVAAGLYNAAYRVIFLLQFLPYLASVALLPQASRLHAANQRPPLTALYHETLGLALLLGVPATAGLWVIGPDLIALIFGDNFALSGEVLRWLSALLLLACLKHPMGAFLTACDRQSQRLRSEWIAALVNVIGNLALIPLFGISGAVAATLLSEATLVAAFLVRLRPLFDWPRIGPRLRMSLSGTAAFCLATVVLPWSSLLLVVPLSIFLYLVTLMLFRDFRHHELAVVVAFLRGR